MVSSLLHKEERSTLYYNKYRYRARLPLVGAGRTAHAKTHKAFLSLISDLQYQAPSFMAHSLKNVDFDKIRDYLAWRATNKGSVFICLGTNKVNAYSNDLAALQLLSDIDLVEYAEAIAVLPVDEIQLTEPKHKYRVYLKARLTKDDLVPSLPNFIKLYAGSTDEIVMSSALAKWCMSHATYWRERETTSYFYVEFDNESTLTLLRLMFDGIISKVFKLTKRS